MSKEENDVEKIMLEFMNKELEPPTDEELEFMEYSKKFEERFGRKPYIAEPSGTIKQTIEAIKICLKEDKDILDELLFPNIENDWIL